MSPLDMIAHIALNQYGSGLGEINPSVSAAKKNRIAAADITGTA